MGDVGCAAYLMTDSWCGHYPVCDGIMPYTPGSKLYRRRQSSGEPARGAGSFIELSETNECHGPSLAQSCTYGDNKVSAQSTVSPTRQPRVSHNNSSPAHHRPTTQISSSFPCTFKL